MPTERGKAPFSGRLTPGQRRWLQHSRAAERSGETLKEYASRRGLSVQSLYQARKRLRRLGAIEPPRRPRLGSEPARAFVKVEPAIASRDPSPTWRIRLPGGLVFESTTPLPLEDLRSLLSALVAPR